MIDEHDLASFPSETQAKIRAQINELTARGYSSEFLWLDRSTACAAYDPFAEESALELCHSTREVIVPLLGRCDGVTLHELCQTLELDAHRVLGIMAVLVPEMRGEGVEIVRRVRTRQIHRMGLASHEAAWRCEP